jgi:hypothetical protein
MKDNAMGGAAWAILSEFERRLKRNSEREFK